MQKHLLCPERMRRIPEHFSWLDHRLVRDGHIDCLSHEAAALYLLLVTVADSQGAGWPRVVTDPGLPQIRSCPFRATGSLSYGFTSRCQQRWRILGSGKGSLSSSPLNHSHVRWAAYDLRPSHFFQHFPA